jgi:hypothetical protein
LEEQGKKLINVKGSPIIQGYNGMKLDLNGRLNVSELEARIRKLEESTI